MFVISVVVVVARVFVLGVLIIFNAVEIENKPVR